MRQVWVPLVVRVDIGEDLPDRLRGSVDLDFGSDLSHVFLAAEDSLQCTSKHGYWR